MPNVVQLTAIKFDKINTKIDKKKITKYFKIKIINGMEFITIKHKLQKFYWEQSLHFWKSLNPNPSIPNFSCPGYSFITI